MATPSLSGYPVGGSQTVGNTSSEADAKAEYWTLERKKRAYKDYVGSKREEIDEQIDSRRMVHSSQWTSKEVEQLNLRRQPVTTNNKIFRKIAGVVGTLNRLKQDPKAYARTPQHEQGAELATAALRYALDAQNWNAKDPQCSFNCGMEGYSGLEFNLIQGDMGDPEIEIDIVDVDSFFYDPRSYRADFSDARYMGTGKWVDLEAAIEMFPDYEDELRAGNEDGTDLTTESDREFRWFQSDEGVKRVRLVNIWYRKNNEWYYGIFTGSTELMEGKSYLTDEKGKSQHKYEMYSCYIDQDGDRYGFVRVLKPLQRQINMRESKALYTMLSRRLILEKGSVDDVEVARREAARPDGVVIVNPGMAEKIQFDDTAKMAETEAQFKFLENVKTDFENFGPNFSLLGQGLEKSSGRAINLLQQAGLADLGPFIQSYRDWKIRVYRKMWNAIQKHWVGERWIRVTDDQDLSQFVQINGLTVDEYGHPSIVNKLGSLDVDIILDEGPDEVNLQGDAYDTLSALATQGTQIPPAVLLELSPLPYSNKQKLLQMLNTPDPNQEAMQQAEIQNLQAKAQDIMASAEMKHAQAMKALAEANAPPEQAQQGEHPALIQAKVDESSAKVEKTKWESAKIQQDMQLEPQRMAMEQQSKQADREQKASEVQHKSVTEQVQANAQAGSDQIGSLGKALVDAATKSAQSLDKASEALMKASENMTVAAKTVADNTVANAIKAPRRLVRDPRTGRATGSEVAE